MSEEIILPKVESAEKSGGFFSTKVGLTLQGYGIATLGSFALTGESAGNALRIIGEGVSRDIGAHLSSIQSSIPSLSNAAHSAGQTISSLSTTIASNPEVATSVAALALIGAIAVTVNLMDKDKESSVDNDINAMDNDNNTTTPSMDI